MNLVIIYYMSGSTVWNRSPLMATWDASGGSIMSTKQKPKLKEKPNSLHCLSRLRWLRMRLLDHVLIFFQKSMADLHTFIVYNFKLDQGIPTILKLDLLSVWWSAIYATHNKSVCVMTTPRNKIEDRDINLYLNSNIDKIAKAY